MYSHGADVGFHVAATFAPQQGAGAGPPGGPPIARLHHQSPGGLAAHQPTAPQPPTQNAPTPQPAASTPPGPGDMGKTHIQQQSAIPPGQMSLAYGVPNQTRPNPSTNFFTTPRGATPRMPGHRGQVVNIPSNNVSQSMFSPHMSTMPQVYPNILSQPINQGNSLYMPNPMQVYQPQPRHQNPSNPGYYAQGQQSININQIHMFSGYAPQAGHQPTTSYYMPFRPGGSIPGGPAGSQNVAPSAALGQPGVPMIAGSSNMLMSAAGSLAAENTGPIANKPSRRKFAVDVVDPKTGTIVDIYENNANTTPPRSGESSARETPQPPAQQNIDLAADFAARVAKAASEASRAPASIGAPSISAPPFVPDHSVAPNMNGPPDVSSIVDDQQELPLSQSPITVDDTWKQTVINSSVGASVTLCQEAVPIIVKEDAVMKMDLQSTLSDISDLPQPLSVPVTSVTPVVSVLSAVEVPQSHVVHRIPPSYAPSKPPSSVSTLPTSTPASPKRSQKVPSELLTSQAVASKPPAPPKKMEDMPPPFQVPAPPPKEPRDDSRVKGKHRDKSKSKESPISTAVRTSGPPGKPAARNRSVSRSPTPPVSLTTQPDDHAPVQTHKTTTVQQNGESTDPTEGSKTRVKKGRGQQKQHLNRKGAEKEGTDMDAFSEPAPPSETVPSHQPSPPLSVVDNQSFKDEYVEISKDEEEEKIVAAKNEENVKVSASLKNEPQVIENIPPKPTVVAQKYSYRDDQWSPLHPEGKKKYDRDLLMELKNAPEALRKPENLPELEIVVKDKNVINRDRGRIMDFNRQSDNFSPAFQKSQSGFQRGPVLKRGSQQGKAKNAKQQMIHFNLSIKGEVKLHEAENAWKPERMRNEKPASDEDDAKTQELYKKVRGILNKLTPQKFETLVSQVQQLPIDSMERLQGVINLVFEKAVDEPSFSVAYARMCHVLSGLKVVQDNSGAGQSGIDFRYLLVSRCQQEFEKNTQEELCKFEKLREIRDCLDPEKKKELQLAYEENERKLRMKSVGNIRFIGELFKLQMLTTKIMFNCIKQLLDAGDEESLECLCKLLSTIGKDLESKNQDISPYFQQMAKIANNKGKVSSRVRFMLQDVIDLRNSKWVPRRGDSNPKTIDQIQKEADRENLEMHLSLSNPTPRRQDERGGGGDRRKRGGLGGPQNNEDWHVQRTTRYGSSLDPSKLKHAAAEEGIFLGNREQFKWARGATGASEAKEAFPVSTNKFQMLQEEDDRKSSSSRPSLKSTPSSASERERMLTTFKSAADEKNKNASRSSSRESSYRSEDINRNQSTTSVPIPVEDKPLVESQEMRSLSEEQVEKKTAFVLEEFFNNMNCDETAQSVSESLPPNNMSGFVYASVNSVLEKKSQARIDLGLLMSHLILKKVIPIEKFCSGLEEIILLGEELSIDVPKCWMYLAEILVPLLSAEAFSFGDLKTVAKGRSELAKELLILLQKEKGASWIRAKWDAASIQWKDFVDGDIDKFIRDNKFEFTIGPIITEEVSQICHLTADELQAKLNQFLNDEPSVDAVFDWISKNVGDKIKQPEYIRAFMTAIVANCVEKSNNLYKLNQKKLFDSHKLVQKYVDADAELELHCLFAVQLFTHSLDQPTGLITSIFQTLWENMFISTESFIKWKKCNDFNMGKGVAAKLLTSFFVNIEETEADSCDES